MTWRNESLFDFGRESGIDRLLWIRMNLELGTMMIGIAAVRIVAMRRHELDYLQSAFRAGDVGYLDIGFLFLIESCAMHEQAIRQNRR